MPIRRPIYWDSYSLAEMSDTDSFPSLVTGQIVSDPLDSGLETYSRSLATGSAATTTGIMDLVYFNCRKGGTTTQGRMVTSTTAAAATPTLCKFGLFLVDRATGDGTRVAVTPNDTLLFAAASTSYTRSWLSPYDMVQGSRYAFARLVVTTAATPGLMGMGALTTALLTEFVAAPRVNGRITGQTDIPASFLDSAVIPSGSRPYGVVLP